MHLRVLAINVWNTAGDSRRIDLLNRELRRIAPDLVAFEEVIQTPARNSSKSSSGGRDFTALIRSTLWHQPHPGSTATGGVRWQLDGHTASPK
jgi:hypothetical protein